METARSQSAPVSTDYLMEVDPMKLKIALEAFSREWGEDFVDELAGRKDNESFTRHFCLELSQICEDADMESFVATESKKIKEMLKSQGFYAFHPEGKPNSRPDMDL